MKIVLAVLAGFVLWTVVFLAGNQLIMKIFAGSYADDGSTQNVVALLVHLVLTVVASLASGYVAAAIAGVNAHKAAWTLGILLLAVGAFAQAGYWNILPLWYHLLFLALLLPGTLFGARLRAA